MTGDGVGSCETASVADGCAALGCSKKIAGSILYQPDMRMCPVLRRSCEAISFETVPELRLIYRPETGVTAVCRSAGDFARRVYDYLSVRPAAKWGRLKRKHPCQSAARIEPE